MNGFQFEWDENKNRKNILKHGISFEEAKTVFYDDMALVFDDGPHNPICEMADKIKAFGWGAGFAVIGQNINENTLPMLTGYQTIIMSYYISIARLQSYQVSHSVFSFSYQPAVLFFKLIRKNSQKALFIYPHYFCKMTGARDLHTVHGLKRKGYSAVKIDLRFIV